MLKSGVSYAIATDCAASNDGANLLGELKLFYLLAKQQGVEVSADDLLAAVTTNPFKALMLDQKLGTLEVGKHADIVFLKNDLSIHPFRFPKVDLIFSDTVMGLEHVMINGEWVLFDRMPSKVNSHDKLVAAEKAYVELMSK